MENKVRSQIVEDSEYGVYVWEDGEGRVIKDEDDNYLCVPSKKGDARKIMALKKVAHQVLIDNGIEPGGRPRFMAGRRQITQTEYEEQQMRLRAGLVPDPYDPSAILESQKFGRKNA